MLAAYLQAVIVCRHIILCSCAWFTTIDVELYLLFKVLIEIVLPLVAIGISKNGKKMALQIFAKIGKYFWKQRFLEMFAEFGTTWQPYKPDNGTSRPVCWHDHGQLTRIRTTRRPKKVEQMNFEKSPQQIWLRTQHSLRCQNKTLTIKTYCQKPTIGYMHSNKSRGFILREKKPA